MWSVFDVLFAADAVVDLFNEACLIDYWAGVIGAADWDTFYSVLFFLFEDCLA